MFGDHSVSKVDTILHSMLTICLLPGVVAAASVPFVYNVSNNENNLQDATSTGLNAADDSPALNLTTSTQYFIANATGYNSSELDGNLQFPPASYIGFGLDMTSTMLFDLKSVCKSTACCTLQQTLLNVFLD